ncbi:MAG: cyclophilin-like fold protein [Thermoproteota archaeon]|nr:cyclophilin-like fold protein [Thermoproteota archaeon]
MAELEFPELQRKVMIELDDSLSPKTVAAIINSLPVNFIINRWGDELYSDAIPVKVEEENSKSEVRLMDVAYWPEGSALCFFYGPTPISKQGKILPYSPVNIIGRITTAIPPENVQDFLKSVEESHIRKRIPIVLR